MLRTMTFEQRLVRMERSLWLWRSFGLAMLLLILLRVFVGAAEKTHFGDVECASLRVTNSMMVKGTNPADEAAFVVIAAKDSAAISLGGGKDGAAFNFTALGSSAEMIVHGGKQSPHQVKLSLSKDFAGISTKTLDKTTCSILTTSSGGEIAASEMNGTTYLMHGDGPGRTHIDSGH